MEDPTIPETTDMTAAEEAVKWKVRLWSQEVDRYEDISAVLGVNKGELYVAIMDIMLKIIKSNIKSKTG